MQNPFCDSSYEDFKRSKSFSEDFIVDVFPDFQRRLLAVVYASGYVRIDYFKFVDSCQWIPLSISEFSTPHKTGINKVLFLDSPKEINGYTVVTCSDDTPIVRWHVCKNGATRYETTLTDKPIKSMAGKQFYCVDPETNEKYEISLESKFMSYDEKGNKMFWAVPPEDYSGEDGESKTPSAIFLGEEKHTPFYGINKKAKRKDVTRVSCGNWNDNGLVQYLVQDFNGDLGFICKGLDDGCEDIKKMSCMNVVVNDDGAIDICVAYASLGMYMDVTLKIPALCVWKFQDQFGGVRIYIIDPKTREHIYLGRFTLQND